MHAVIVIAKLIIVINLYLQIVFLLFSAIIIPGASLKEKTSQHLDMTLHTFSLFSGRDTGGGRGG